MNKVKVRKCKMCRTGFQLYRSTQVVCSIKCAKAYAEQKRIKEQKANDKKRKEKLKTAKDYNAEAQVAFNRYIRARDCGKYCSSCSTVLIKHTLGGGYDAGHYRSRGASNHLRFNLLNVWGQCKRCNRRLGGNYSEYRKKLIKRIGLDRVEKLENDNEPRKLSIEYLKRVKKIFNKRARFYENRRE